MEFMKTSQLITKAFISSILSIYSSRCYAQEDFRIWENMTAVINLGTLDKGLEKWRLWAEGQGRFRENGGAADQALARGALGYQLNEKTSIWFGFANVTYYPSDRKLFHEHRVWQQLMLTERASFGEVTSRTRLEQRIIEDINPVEWRLREFVRFSRPIFEGSPVSFVLWDEVFVRLNTTIPAAPFGFDQNRVFSGLGYTFNKNIRVEVGYMNQLIQFRTVIRREQRFDTRMNHILSINMFLNL
jgi:hypothetical protein